MGPKANDGGLFGSDEQSPWSPMGALSSVPLLCVSQPLASEFPATGSAVHITALKVIPGADALPSSVYFLLSLPRE